VNSAGGRRGPGQVRLDQVVEVLFLPEDMAAGVVQLQEGLQAVEPVPGPQFLGIRGRQRDAVARRQPDQQLRLQRALDVEMQFGDRQHVRDCAARATLRSVKRSSVFPNRRWCARRQPVPVAMNRRRLIRHITGRREG